MKKYFYILAAVAALASCTKEVAINEENVTPVEDQEVHELFVSIPDMVDVDTKAAINPDDGKFSWTAGDAIAVKTSTDDVYQFTASENGSAVRFTYTGTMNGTPVSVKYPYTVDFSDTALLTEIEGATGALGASALRMEGTVSANSVTLEHKNALLKVTFTNVPSFASGIHFIGNTSEEIEVISLSPTSEGKVYAYIPVSISNTGFTIDLCDNNGNIIVSKSTTSPKSFTAGTLKNMSPVSVSGHVFIFNDNDKVDEARFFATDGSTVDYSKYNNITLNVLKDGVTKWCILPTSNDWSKTGNAVCIQIWKNDSWVSSSEAIWLYRDFTFDTTEGSLKTAYRIYVYMSDSQWNPWQTQGSGTTVVKFTTWGGISTPATNAIMERNADNNGYICYYEFQPVDYGKESVKYRFYNEYNAGWESKNESGITLNRDIWGSNL